MSAEQRCQPRPTYYRCWISSRVNSVSHPRQLQCPAKSFFTLIASTSHHHNDHSHVRAILDDCRSHHRVQANHHTDPSSDCTHQPPLCTTLVGSMKFDNEHIGLPFLESSAYLHSTDPYDVDAPRSTSNAVERSHFRVRIVTAKGHVPVPAIRYTVRENPGISIDVLSSITPERVRRQAVMLNFSSCQCGLNAVTLLVFRHGFVKQTTSRSDGRQYSRRVGH
ncbi:hypothetical protein H257_08129 [Aphanomyces astaci]|uniref:Uncharacterized protein n=1 Tax=Aphanomyces astaci TaxID=112090 RepID=W4GHY9_APHAT|nr:hypothetical protein H257_08129 [Aphanomyces astaci]ETV78639.1 hypothetical protein H257_08129 [Aphanomyces astaci]|eukprot:XP_009832220.1 hypothetical protein H257_08129 [Aphanomyces astaci]